MNIELLGYAIVLLLAGIFSIATTSIGIQCANANSAYKEEHSSNQTFLIVNLVSAILVVIIALVGIYLAATGK